MAKIKPNGKRSKKSSRKSILHTVAPSPEKRPPSRSWSDLLEEATALLHTGQPADALRPAQNALSLLKTSPPPRALPALNLLAEIYVELGDSDAARSHFLQAAELDPDGAVPEGEGGGAEKFLWLAQLCEEGGEESVRWFERGVDVLRREIGELEGSSGKRSEEEDAALEEKRRKIASALCGTIEVYMTDLALDPSAESRCESLIASALLHAPNSPEPLQTLASIRVSQLRLADARAALARSLELWQHLPPDAPSVPDFPTRVSLARLLLETEMEDAAIDVLERLVGEDDQSVEVWYLGGWGLYLMGQKKRGSPGTTQADDGEDWRVLWIASREWLQNCLRLYRMLEWGDNRLRDHALELVEGLNAELGGAGEESEGEEGVVDGTVGEDDEWEDEDGDQEMEGT
ncbi:MAG: NAD-dependent histone deacetylase sir2 [Trichoglossum hirsutum]|nr:MAG: NAD-dependent histone deacetylase sir2 [Trichoglossum hirsutum]